MQWKVTKLSTHIRDIIPDRSTVLDFWTRKGSLIATTIVLVVLVLVVVTRFRKMPKALLIRNGKLRNFAHTFVTSFPTDVPS